MGIALFTLSSLLTPLQGLLSRLVPAHSRAAERPRRRPTVPLTPTGKTRPRATFSPGSSLSPARAAACRDGAVRSRRTLPLRVVRTIDSGIPAGSTGRMMISGRMADVCAELDRLAAMEAAL